jgi:hypothetical protein
MRCLSSLWRPGALAREFRIHGTPRFVLGDEFLAPLDANPSGRSGTLEARMTRIMRMIADGHD